MWRKEREILDDKCGKKCTRVKNSSTHTHTRNPLTLPQKLLAGAGIHARVGGSAAELCHRLLYMPRHGQNPDAFMHRGEDGPLGECHGGGGIGGGG